MNPAPKVVEIACSSVGELWDLLSPAGGKFDQYGHHFLFRGQRDSTWALIPKVYRTDIIERYKRGMMRVQRDHPGQWLFEYMLLSSFMAFCDQAGLAVPGDSMEFRDYFHLSQLSNRHAIDSKNWPEDRIVPLMALAQHHGIPTRLLDWSSNSMVACYHAAESVVRGDMNGNGQLAIFALEQSRIHPQMKLKHVRVPGSTSPNVSSQRGSFILVTNSGRRGQEFTPDVSLESQLPDHPAPLLHKLTLPQSLAWELLLRCHKFGVSGSFVFPGYDGTARAALESVMAYNRMAEG